MSNKFNIVNVLIGIFLAATFLLVSGSILFKFYNGGSDTLASARVHILLQQERLEALANILVELPSKKLELPQMPTLALPEFAMPEVPELKIGCLCEWLLRKILDLKEFLFQFLEGIRAIICSFLFHLHNLVSSAEAWVRCNLTNDPCPLTCSTTWLVSFKAWIGYLMCIAARLAQGSKEQDEFLLVIFNMVLAAGITYIFSLILSLMTWIDLIQKRRHHATLDIEVRVSDVSST